ncbi:MAG: hypothetical protein RLZZ414_751, partial [Bacteroidota bacterium]
MKKIFYLLNIILLSFGLNEVKAQTCSSYKVLTSEIKICQNSVGINLLNNINISVNGTTSKLSAYPSTMFSLDSLYFNNTQQSTFSYLGTITALSNSTNSFFTPRFYAITKNANSITNADINKTEFFNVYFKLPSCTKIYSVKIYVVPFERAYFDFSNNYDNDFYETAKNLDDVKEYRNLGSTCGYTKFFLNKYAFPYSNTNVISGKNVTPTGEYPKSYSGVARVDSVTILHTSADGCIFTGYGKIVINDLDPRLKNILIDKSTNEIDLNFGILPTYYQNVFTYEAYLNSSTNKVCFSPQQNITSALIQKGNLPNATSVTEIYNGNGLPINTNDFYFKNSGDSLTINLNKNKNYYNVSINYSMLYAPILQANYPLYGCNIKFNSDLNINFPRMDSLKNIRICNKDTIIDLTKEIKASIPVKAFSWTGLDISNNLFNSSLIKNDTIIKQTLNIEETNTTCTNYNLSRFVYISKPKN